MNFGSPDDELAMKRCILALLVQEMQSDNHLALREEQYLAYAASELGLEAWEINAIRNDPSAYLLSPPCGEKERLTMLYYLLFMMWADGEVRPKEEEMCHHVGFSLGFRRDMVSDLVGTMKAYLREKLPPNVMLERIKPYLN